MIKYKKSKNKTGVPSITAVWFGRFFRFCGYLSLFLGLMAVVASIIGFVATYWPQTTESQTVMFNEAPTKTSSWTITISAVFMPMFSVIFLTLSVAAIILFWSFAKRYTENIVNWINKQTLWPKWIIEISGVVILWVLVIVSVAILVPEWAYNFGLAALIMMWGGLICFGLTRVLTRQYLD